MRGYGVRLYRPFCDCCNSSSRKLKRMLKKRARQAQKKDINDY